MKPLALHLSTNSKKDAKKLTRQLCYYIVCIVFNYKKLIELKSDDTKPNFSFKSYGEEEDD